MKNFDDNRMWIGYIVILLLVVFPIIGGYAFPGINAYLVHVATFICIMTILALGLHIFFGICGQINFGANGFYAVGGYFAALSMIYLNVHFFVALPLAIIGTGLVTLIVGNALLRLRHWVLALGTMAFGVAVFIALRTIAVDYLGGDDGLFLPDLVIFGKNAGSLFYFYFIFALTLLCIMGAYSLENSRAGRAMKAIREDEITAQTMGIDVNHYVRIAFLLNGVYCGLAGALYAQWNVAVSPSSFNTDIAMMVLVFVIVGGLGHLYGAIIGTVFICILPEILVPLKQYELLIYAIVFFLVIRFFPQGLWGVIRKTLVCTKS